MLTLALPFAVIGLTSARTSGRKVLYGLAVALIIAGAVSTQRKTSVIAPVAAVLVLVAYRPRQMLRLAPFGAVLLVTVHIMAPEALGSVSSQITGGFFDSGSTIGRTSDYEAIAPDIATYPLLGRGYGTIDVAQSDTYRILDNAVSRLALSDRLRGTRRLPRPARHGHGAGAQRHPARARRGQPADRACGDGRLRRRRRSDRAVRYRLLHPGALPLLLRRRPLQCRRRAPRARSHWLPHGGTLGMNVPDLSVVVVTHNGRELALATLRSARANTGPIAVEWLVADSGSSDSTPEAIEHEFPDVRVFRCVNLGFAHANNVALRAARGRYVLLLNPDIEIEEGRFADLVAALDERPEVGAASVLQRGADGSLLPSIRRFPSPFRDFGEALFCPRWPLLRHVQELDLEFDRYLEERRADWLSGAFLVARRETVEQVGPLDERFFLYSEEIDWCYRIRHAGWDIRHLPVMEVTHHCGSYSPERAAELCHSRLLFARKHFSPEARDGDSRGSNPQARAPPGPAGPVERLRQGSARTAAGRGLRSGSSGCRRTAAAVPESACGGRAGDAPGGSVTGSGEAGSGPSKTSTICVVRLRIPGAPRGIAC